jgi:hypothetical protein
MIPMNVDFMEVLDSITAKSVSELEPDEIAFLKARVYYLTPGQLQKFDSILVEPSIEEPKKRVFKKTK